MALCLNDVMPLSRILLVLQVLAGGCAVVLGLWNLPALAVVCLGLLGAGASAARMLGARAWEKKWLRLGIATALWACSVAVPASLLPGGAPSYTLGGYYAAVALLMSAVLLAGALDPGCSGPRVHYKILSVAWAFLGDLLWLAGSYGQNLQGQFYCGLLLGVALLAWCKAWFRLPGLGVQAANTLLLLLIGLPIADWLVRPAQRTDARPQPGPMVLSFEAAKRDPEAFRRWWNYFVAQWDVMAKAVFMPDPDGVLPYRLWPGSRGRLFQSCVSVNSLGFRGKEIAREKGSAYRIIALGESTTFGCTLVPDDKPWPELLEQMIRERLRPPRAVQVINAGLPLFNLEQNLLRLRSDLLPLEPDMIISYHGLNGFRLFDESVPSMSSRAPPVYKPRPLKLLADCEYRLKILYHRRRQTLNPAHPRPNLMDVTQSKYARAYRQLIEAAQTNGIRLVLANFSMAVNERSAPELLEFYGTRFPAVAWMVKANEVHSQAHPGPGPPIPANLPGRYPPRPRWGTRKIHRLCPPHPGRPPAIGREPLSRHPQDVGGGPGAARAPRSDAVKAAVDLGPRLGRRNGRASRSNA